jgi:hypothetical protein
MVWRILGRIGLAGTSLVLVAALWVVTHLRDLPDVNDADLRTIHKVAPDLDAAPDLYRAASLLHLEKDQEEHLQEWSKGKSWDEEGVTALLAENAAALEALTAADGKPGFTIPPDRTEIAQDERTEILLRRGREEHKSPEELMQELMDKDLVSQDTMAWLHLRDLRLLRALRLHRQGQTRAALAEILATARLGHVIEGAANGDLMHYPDGAGIKGKAFNRLTEVAASSKLPRETLLALSADVSTLGANERGLAAAWAGEYRGTLAFLERISVSSRAPDNGAKSLLLFLFEERSSRVLGTILPVEYLYQPHRTEALYVDSYRSLQRSGGQTYLVYSREADDMKRLKLETPFGMRKALQLLLEPNASGLAHWRMIAPGEGYLVRFKCRENVHAAATSTILALLAYEHEHGSLPDRLDELVPGELSQVPIDDFDGAPLRYSRERRRLWSVGTELRDEGGSDDGTTSSLEQPTFLIPG